MRNKPRKPWLAGLLTFLTIGLGHIYAGRPQRGVVLFLVKSILLAVTLTLFLAGPTPALLISLIISGFAYFMYCLIDSIKIAKENRFGYQIKKYNKWYIYLASWVTATIIIQSGIGLIIKHNKVHAYKIPSGSMRPTLMVGDHILVDRLINKSNKPQRGDIIVFPHPKAPYKDFVKRLIGLEGDIIEILDKQLYINKKLFVESYIINKDHMTYTASQNSRDFFGPVTVPPNSYFVMGDNRDNSNDSRFWGFVDKNTVKGRVKSLYWSWDTEKSRVRWKRIGKTLEQVTNQNLKK